MKPLQTDGGYYLFIFNKESDDYAHESIIGHFVSGRPLVSCSQSEPSTAPVGVMGPIITASDAADLKDVAKVIAPEIPIPIQPAVPIGVPEGPTCRDRSWILEPTRDPGDALIDTLMVF